MDIDINPLKTLNLGLKKHRRFPLPLVTTVFEYKRNPLEKDDHARFVELANWFFMYCDMPAKKYQKNSGGGLFASYFFPFCNNVERFETVFLITLAMFLIDDDTEYEHGNDQGKFVRSLKIWHDFLVNLERLISKEYIPIGQWSPHVLCIHSLMQNVFSKFNETQKRRFVSMWKISIECQILEVKFIRDKKIYQSVEEFIEVRIDSGGGNVFTQLLEYTEDIVLTDDDWKDIHLQRYIRLVGKGVIVLNDFYSFEKESNAVNGDIYAMLNLVAVIMICDKCEVSEAYDKTIRIYKETEEEMLALIKVITERSECTEEVKIFVKKASYIMSANIGCSIVLDRYNDCE